MNKRSFRRRGSRKIKKSSYKKRISRRRSQYKINTIKRNRKNSKKNRKNSKKNRKYSKGKYSKKKSGGCLPRMCRKKNKKNKKNKLTPYQIDIIKNTVTKITIPAGTILYRSQDKHCNEDEGQLKDVYDSDTGRMGQYFSDGPIIPYGMIMEYNKPMYLCKFKVVEDINNVLEGKYSYRKNDPENYYETYEDYEKHKFISDRDPREQTSSIGEGYYPLHDFFQLDEGDMPDLINENEIFLSSEDTNNWQKLQHLETTELISPEEARILIKKIIYTGQDIEIINPYSDEEIINSYSDEEIIDV